MFGYFFLILSVPHSSEFSLSFTLRKLITNLRTDNAGKTQKTVNATNISRMSIVLQKKANQIQDCSLKPQLVASSLLVSGSFIMCLIGLRTVNIPAIQVSLSVHSFLNFTVIETWILFFPDHRLKRIECLPKGISPHTLLLSNNEISKVENLQHFAHLQQARDLVY